MLPDVSIKMTLYSSCSCSGNVKVKNMTSRIWPTGILSRFIKLTQKFCDIMKKFELVKIQTLRYCLINIACFWIFDVLPISVTALLPYILFPSLGLMSSGAVAAKYMSNTNLLLVGGFMIAIAIEETGLHQVTLAVFWVNIR